MSNASKAGKSSSYFHFIAGLGSGISSAVLLQPVDLLKTRVQQSHATTLSATIRSIAAGPNAIRAFWRGTLPSTLRTGFGSALYFTGLNALRERVARSSVLRPLVVGGGDGSGNGTGNVNTNAGTTSLAVSASAPSSSALPKLSNLANLTTGAVARAAAGFVLMPMTVIKVRYESSLYTYQSMPGAIKDILRTEGVRGFFAGFGATAIRDAPYAGLYVVFYEQLKKRLSKLQHTAALDEREMKASTSASINFTSGGLAAGLATALTNPFDAIKTRVQLQPKEYHNLVQAGKKMVRTEGFGSLFDGLGLRMGRKALSSALAWTLYEELIRRGETVFQRKAQKEIGL